MKPRFFTSQSKQLMNMHEICPNMENVFQTALVFKMAAFGLGGPGSVSLARHFNLYTDSIFKIILKKIFGTRYHNLSGKQLHLACSLFKCQDSLQTPEFKRNFASLYFTVQRYLCLSFISLFLYWFIYVSTSSVISFIYILVKGAISFFMSSWMCKFVYIKLFCLNTNFPVY